MTGVHAAQMLVLVALAVAVLAVGNAQVRDTDALLGDHDCSIWDCCRPGEFTEADGTRRCMAHVGQPIGTEGVGP